MLLFWTIPNELNLNGKKTKKQNTLHVKRVVALLHEMSNKNFWVQGSILAQQREINGLSAEQIQKNYRELMKQSK